ncbi:MAG: LodA/GoxA family CTQ-dependent oxidase [bacterium]
MKSTTYRIHPAIGVGRVGDSEEWYYAPETPGGLPINPDGKPFGADDFRDASGALRRQAARFRVWRFGGDDDPGAPVSLGDDIAAIEWTVHVANKKASWYTFATNEGEYGYSPDHPLRNAGVEGDARRGLMIDPGPRTLAKPGDRVRFDAASCPEGYTARFPTGLLPYDIETLGDALVTDDGSLVVAGGHGRSGSTIHPAAIGQYANNDGWFDDTSDGQIDAVVVLTNGRRVPVEGAWFLCGPPGYAPQIENLVTLYDTMMDAFIRDFGIRPEVYRDSLWQDDYHPDYATEIRPLLARAIAYKWVIAIPPNPHTLDLDALGDPDPAYNGLRGYYLDHMRGPDQGNELLSSTGVPMMPWLAGDNALIPGYFSSKYLTLTRTQYFFLRQWARGRFVNGGRPAPSGAAAVDQGVLENCVGGAFSPGIEMTWISREPRIYRAPFRIRHRAVDGKQGLSLGLDLDRGLEPGDVTRYMAVPWQADFNECSSQPIDGRFLWWWPAQRPLYVREPADPEKVVAWAGTFENQNAPDYLAFADDIEMVHRWKDQGFIFNTGTEEKPLFVQVAKREPPAS